MTTAERKTCPACGGRSYLVKVWGASARRLPEKEWQQCHGKCHGKCQGAVK